MTLLKTLTAATLAIAASSAVAAPFTPNVTGDVYQSIVNGIPTANDHNDGSPDLYQAANAVLGTTFTSNTDLDSRFVAADQVFIGNGQHSIALIGLTAGNKNTLGVYTDIGTGASKTAVLGPESGFGFTGNGSVGSPFTGATFNITGNFAWYLDSVSGSGTSTYYSESALNVADQGLDHMMTFAMNELNGQSVFVDYGMGATSYTFANAFLIGWEDMRLLNGVLGDDDYDDMIYLVDFRPVHVPESSNLALLMLGLLGIAAARRKNV